MTDKGEREKRIEGEKITVCKKESKRKQKRMHKHINSLFMTKFFFLNCFWWNRSPYCIFSSAAPQRTAYCEVPSQMAAHLRINNPLQAGEIAGFDSIHNKVFLLRNEGVIRVHTCKRRSCLQGNKGGQGELPTSARPGAHQMSDIRFHARFTTEQPK